MGTAGHFGINRLPGNDASAHSHCGFQQEAIRAFALRVASRHARLSMSPASAMMIVGAYVGFRNCWWRSLPVFLLAWLRFSIAAVAMAHWLPPRGPMSRRWTAVRAACCS